jgi:hypothetical protein
VEAKQNPRNEGNTPGLYLDSPAANPVSAQAV